MLAPTADAHSAHWLARAHPHPREVYAEWTQRPVAMLPLGAVFDAVRIPAPVVIAGAGSDEEEDINSLLAETVAGPVIVDPGVWYYALVPAGTTERWISQYVSCLGTAHWLGVPKIGRAVGPGPHWAVPMERAGTLCKVKPVEEFVALGGRRLYRQRPVTT